MIYIIHEAFKYRYAKGSRGHEIQVRTWCCVLNCSVWHSKAIFIKEDRIFRAQLWWKDSYKWRKEDTGRTRTIIISTGTRTCHPDLLNKRTEFFKLKFVLKYVGSHIVNCEIKYKERKRFLYTFSVFHNDSIL